MKYELCNQCVSEVNLRIRPYDGLCECGANLNRVELKSKGLCQQCFSEIEPSLAQKGICSCDKGKTFKKITKNIKTHPFETEEEED